MKFPIASPARGRAARAAAWLLACAWPAAFAPTAAAQGILPPEVVQALARADDVVLDLGAGRGRGPAEDGVAWRRELLTFCRTRVTNARTEAANLTAKTIKRVGRGYRNHRNYRCRIIGYAPRPIAA